MTYVFDDVEINAETRAMARGGLEVHVEPKVMDLLLFLIRHRSRMVSKQVLLREIWPEAVVSENSLTRLVKEARRAVGDDGRQQAVIRTIHGRGYRFVCEIEVQGGNGSSEYERALELARLSLEASLEAGARDLRERVTDFVRVCEQAVRAAQAG